jgi:hypothetical protein
MPGAATAAPKFEGNIMSLLAYNSAVSNTTKTVTNVITNTGDLSATVVNFALIAFTALGFFMIGHGLYTFYKATNNQQATPQNAIASLAFGAMLTCLTTIAFMLRNELIQ